MTTEIFGAAPHRILAQATTTHPSDGYFWVLLYAFGLLLILFILMNADRRFREYMGRSLARPFNFFADIRDRRLIPNAQTTLLALAISGASGIALATTMRAAASFPEGTLYLSTFLPSSLYTSSSGFAVSYIALIFLSTADIFVGILLITIILRFWAMFVRGRYSFGDTYNIAVWSLTPLTFLLAYDLVSPRMDISSSTATVSSVILAVILLWCYIRMLKGTGVLFDIYPTKIYGYGLILLSLAIGIIILVLRLQ